MQSDLTFRQRRATQTITELTSGDDRYVDFGVLLQGVKQHDSGIEAYPGGPRIVSVGEQHRFGGMLDTRTRQFVGPSENPRVWLIGESHIPMVLHGDGLAQKILCYGGEGSGKTAGVLRYWILCRALEFTGMLKAEIGVTAPTTSRLEIVIEALKDIMPSSWYTYHAHSQLFTLRNGVRIRCVSTKQYSEALGSRIQGYSWFAAASDELQDSLTADSDIEARGRAAPNGIYKRLCTATAKDSPDWRTHRDRVISQDRWCIRRLPGFVNPFLHQAFWEALMDLPPREYRRRVLAQDVGPERALYYTWERDTNVRPIPAIGSRDVTAYAQRAYGQNITMLVGHDPGTIQDCSILLRAYSVTGKPYDYVWYVVDELTTSGTSEHHANELAKLLREKWRVGRGCELIRCDPYGDSDNRTDYSVYKTFANVGLNMRSAQYTEKGKGTGRIGKEARIEMLNGLICSASGDSRLFVNCDDHRKPCAERLVTAIEMSSRDEAGRAETERKDKNDLSHWPTALSFALWPTEKVRLGSQRREIVL